MKTKRVLWMVGISPDSCPTLESACLELAQESQIATIEIANVGDTVTSHA